MKPSKVFIFGNPDLREDSLPLRLVPHLKEKFSETEFAMKDPNEDWDVPEELTVIDTALNIKEPEVFDDVGKFEASPRVSLHDFDALFNLRLLKKLGKLKTIKILCLPPDYPEAKALAWLAGELEKLGF